MPMRLLKSETDERLLIERVMYARRYSLILDRERCVVCELCEAACPREAIHITKPPEGGDAEEAPRLDIDVELCHYCGICNAICPFGALELRIDGRKALPVVEFESFPQIIREVEVDVSLCPVGCRACEEACPLDLIRVRVLDPEGNPVEDPGAHPDVEGFRVEVEIDRDHCPVCRVCEFMCPYDAIHTQKALYGYIEIDTALCPEGCRACVDACPIPEAMEVSEDGEVSVNDVFCVYCGACRVVCPVEGAITLQRTSIRHTPVRSGAWNKALEKITSTREMTKELRGKALVRVRESVERRLGWRST